MPELTQLRLPDEDEFSWYAMERAVERPLGCHNCNRRIDPGEPHARGDEDGRRLCKACVSACWVGDRMSAAEANRRRRDLRYEHAMEAGARMLLDGLEVGTISELKNLVDAARAGVVVTPQQVASVASMFPTSTVLLRPGPGGVLEGTVHAEVAGANTYVKRRACLFAPDVTREHGNLGISYDALMGLPKGSDGR